MNAGSEVDMAWHEHIYGNERQSIFDLIRLAIPFRFITLTSRQLPAYTVIKLDLAHQAIVVRLSKAMATRHLKTCRALLRSPDK